MKNCYNNPKNTGRIGFQIGKCYSNMSRLEYQRDMDFVRGLISNRDKEIGKMIKHAVLGVVAWGFIMLVIWFLLMNPELIK